MPESRRIDEIDRRTFLGTLAALGIGGVGFSACNGNTGETMNLQGRRLDRIGVQLYTIRSIMEQDVEGTLRTVSEIGYHEVETHTFFDRTPEQFRELLDRYNLVSPAGHVPIGALRGQLDATLAAAQTVGQQWAVVPWLDPAERSVDGYRRAAADLNSFGRAARERGMRVGYHNHEFEFEPLEGGQTGYDILLTETDPELVDMELDLFWTVAGGHDPIALFERHPGRFPLCHVKDMQDPGGAQRMVDVGQGDIDFASIFAHADRAGLRHYFVEHDNPADPLATLRTSHAYLDDLTI